MSLTEALDHFPSSSENAPAGAALLRAESLSFAYPGCPPALQGVDFEARRGSITMVLGRSGSGKTTLLKLMAGLLRPQEGSIRRLSPGPLRIAYIPQTLGLVRSMTAMENVLTGSLGSVPMVRSLFRSFPLRTVHKARALLAQLGIADKESKPVFYLSGGERQRVAISRALIQEAHLILADEFVSQLDALTTDEMLDLARRLAAGGVGLVITTHDNELVSRFADDVVIMATGSVRHTGPAAEISSAQMLEHLSAP